MPGKIQKSLKRYNKFGVPLFVFFSFTLLALQSPQPNHKTETSQQSTTDEHRSSIVAEADSLLTLSNNFIRKGKFQDALQTAVRSLELNEEIQNYRSIGNCHNKIATIYYYQGDFSKALSCFEDGIRSYEKAEFKHGVATLINNKGAIYYYLGNFPKALEHYKKAAALNATLNNKLQSATTTQNIGGIYLELEDYDQSMNHFQKAKKTYQELSDTLSLSQINNSIGDVYHRKDSFDLALAHYEEALQLARSIDAQQSILEVVSNLGDIHRTLENYDLAINYYSQAKELSYNMNNTLYQSLSQIGIGSTLINKDRLSKAIDNCLEGLRISTEIKTISVQQSACDCLYKAYKLSKKEKLSLKYLERSIILKDSLQARQTADKVLNMEFEKKMLLDSIAHIEKEQRIEREHQAALHKKEKQRNAIIVILTFIVLGAIAIWSRLNYVKKSKKRLQKEKDRSDHLLLNILPGKIADELKDKGSVEAQDFETAAILFTDFKSFTATASQLNPKELVQELNICFKAFDHIIDQHQIEKIKTIGDAYMAVGGVPQPDINAVGNTVRAALEMQEFIIERKRQNDLFGKPSFEMRIGIHVGPIVAGVVGVKKFQYDIWGDTVNTASRMESNGDVGRVNISKDTYLMVRNEQDFAFEYRGKINAKGKGAIEMYFVSKCSNGHTVNKAVPQIEVL